MDATLKETNLRRSLKKFFIDGLPDVHIRFDRIITAAMLDESPKQWIHVGLRRLRINQVSEAEIPVVLFSQLDEEGIELSLLRDRVLELLYPGLIDLYDTFQNPWVKVGGFFVTIMPQLGTTYNPDQSKSITLPLILKWGAVW